MPVIKITGNPRTYQRMKENIDINAGTVITGEKSLQEVGEEIYQEILAVASAASWQRPKCSATTNSSALHACREGRLRS